ncbi:TPA: hypothetical protein RNS57_002802 [Stenotrophomonas maltophilia]|nr:hypothetical protein [Stenotrophomonas maltophilia]HDX0798725.1 hypothetical protein [Stenotrophomonas maltophilia]HDX0940954.1 hypothetical protein [Stenotrophomonas maltophilia]
MLTIEVFRDRFQQLTAGWTWQVQGFLDDANNVHPIDTDTKVISTVFERLAGPVVRTIAKEFDYVVELANQTTYPDFTLTQANPKPGTKPHRIALDIKTTYRSRVMKFTLGGYNSFLRNDTKNILYPYSTFQEHWVLGFIYTQRAPAAPYLLGELPKPGEIECPYENVFSFIRRKEEITGLSPGSGNTKNIGSIQLTSAEEFASASGPFSQFGLAKEASDFYWKNYGSFEGKLDARAIGTDPRFAKFARKPEGRKP